QLLLLLHGKNPIEVTVVFLAHGGQLLAFRPRIERGIRFDGLQIVDVGVDDRSNFGGLVIGQRHVLTQAGQFSSLNRFRICTPFWSGGRGSLSRHWWLSRGHRGLSEGLAPGNRDRKYYN